MSPHDSDEDQNDFHQSLVGARLGRRNIMGRA